MIAASVAAREADLGRPAVVSTMDSGERSFSEMKQQR
jgi:hypothetical protein